MKTQQWLAASLIAATAFFSSCAGAEPDVALRENVERTTVLYCWDFGSRRPALARRIRAHYRATLSSLRQSDEIGWQRLPETVRLKAEHIIEERTCLV